MISLILGYCRFENKSKVRNKIVRQDIDLNWICDNGIVYGMLDICQGGLVVTWNIGSGHFDEGGEESCIEICS